MTRTERARQSALGAAGALPSRERADHEPSTPPAIRFQNAGRLLILGADESALALAASLEGELEPHVLLPNSPEPRDSQAFAAIPLRVGELMSLSGYLGRFEGTVKQGSRSRSLLTLFDPLEGRPLADPAPFFDLVLDLYEHPALRQEKPPLGYEATRGDAAAIAPCLESLSNLAGGVEKPKFFAYDAGLCAHEGRGLKGCRLCIEACPTEAIRSVGGRIEIDPYLCQGAGSCSTVCPTGAVVQTAPALSHSIEKLGVLLDTFLDAGGEHPSLLVHDASRGAREAQTLLERCGAHVLPFEVAELPSVGMELWLTALACGAEEVILLEHDALGPKCRDALEEQIGYARGLLAGMGYDIGALALEPASEAQKRLQTPTTLEGAAAREGSLERAYLLRVRPRVPEKRATLHAAIDALHAMASESLEEATLREGAPFGELLVEQSRCVLCMACVTVCPLHALRESRDRPALLFVEEACVQCGLCVTACPQQAITLSARYVFDAAARTTPRVLHEEEPFHCVACGQPFATRSLIETVIERLKQHQFLENDEQIERMKRCERCRASDRPAR